jgi:hypothetical protein
MAEEQKCVVCGQGSHRSDWVKTATVGGKKFVACDNHVQADVDAAAKKAAGAAPAPTPKPVASRVPGQASGGTKVEPKPFTVTAPPKS